MKIQPFLFLIFCLCTLFNSTFAQFPNIRWEYPLGAPAFGSAAAADLDEDGFYEIVFTTYTNDGKAHCLNAEDGSPKWVYDIGGCGDVAPIIHDMNGDGTLDVVVNGSCNPTMFCINGATGALIWSTASGGGDSPPTVADMDGDGKPEILFGNFEGQIRVLNGEDGSFAKVIQVIPNALQTEPTLVDVNGDGKLDILAANFFNDTGLFVWAYDYNSGQVLWVNEKTNPDADFHAYHGGAVADIDNDGLLEYVIGSGAGFVQAINVEDGSDLWVHEVVASNMGAISIADLDEDGVLEIIFNNNDYITLDERIWVLSGLDGTVEWSYPVTFNSFRGMSISDINGNGKLDLVSGHFMGMLRVVEPYTGLIWEINLRNQFSNAALFPWFETDHQPLIADFDKNGTLDVFAVAGYGTYEPDSLNIGRAFLVEAGVGTCPEWLMFRQNIHRTGYLSEEDINLSCQLTPTTSLAADALEFTIFPNPNTGDFHIEYLLPNATQVQIQLFDALGREVITLVNAFQTSGNHLVESSELASFLNGVYFCRMELDGAEVVYKKLIIN